jgi:hypothetical protein
MPTTTATTQCSSQGESSSSSSSGDSGDGDPGCGAKQHYFRRSSRSSCKCSQQSSERNSCSVSPGEDNTEGDATDGEVDLHNEYQRRCEFSNNNNFIGSGGWRNLFDQ